MKQILQKIALASAGIFFALLLCESLIWLLPASLQPLRLRELTQRMELYRRTDTMYLADPELLFKIRPNIDTMVDHPDYHVRIKTNLNLDGMVSEPVNAGTDKNPIARMSLTVSWSNGRYWNLRQDSRKFYIDGNGDIEDADRFIENGAMDRRFHALSHLADFQPGTAYSEAFQKQAPGSWQ